MRTKDFVLRSTKNNLRTCPAFCYVYHDPETEMAVASDKYILYASEKEYKPTAGNGLRTTKGEPAPYTGRYVRWTVAIPNSTRPITLRPDLASVYKKAKEAVDASVLLGLKVYGNPLVNVAENLWFNLKYVGKILEAGINDWEVATPALLDRKEAPIIKRWDEQLLVVMPFTRVSPSEEEISEGFIVEYEDKVEHKTK